MATPLTCRLLLKDHHHHRHESLTTMIRSISVLIPSKAEKILCKHKDNARCQIHNRGNLHSTSAANSNKQPDSDFGKDVLASSSSLQSTIEPPQNEPIVDYEQDSNNAMRLKLLQTLDEFTSNVQDIPAVIGGKRFEVAGEWRYQSIPFDHQRRLARFKYTNAELIAKAINLAQEANHAWSETSLDKRVELFQKAADLAASPAYRYKLIAATMLGQAKTIFQAEIDAAAELVDFFRFNAHYAKQLLDWSQPVHSKPKNQSVLNTISFRPLDGFVASISPFNFTAIGANLAAAPALMGNCVAWKPSDSSILANYITMQILEEAGFPDGVINFIPADGFQFGRLVTAHPHLAGINFTGSLATFRWLWNEVGLNIRRYQSFPRLSGECGGKNFHFIHESAQVDVAIAQTIRSAFEYSGQKCSACSRLYVPARVWKTEMRDKMVDIVGKKLKLGPATDFDTYLSAVIDAKSFEKIESYLNFARTQTDELKIICGGKTDSTIGYYVEPTIIECKNPGGRLMQEEIFGPILSVYVYPDGNGLETLDLIDDCRYALTGSIFAQDESFIELASGRLRMAAGNFYINDKSTGAVVGQQPFGGARLSGTNDKPGGPHNLMRWCNQRTTKRNYKPATDWLA